MSFSKEDKKRAREYTKAIRNKTHCVYCGRQPIEWHSDDHIVNYNQRVSGLAARGHPISRIRKEIKKCKALCRLCHMKEDGRLAKLRKACPNQKGTIFVHPKPCIVCKKPYKPLRRGLCNACNHKKRKGQLTN